jgi:hypothetical protein
MNRVTKQRLKAASQYCFQHGIVGEKLKTYLVATCGVSEAAVDRYLNAGRPHPSNPHKRARAIAFAEARRRGLWKQGEAEVYKKWWRRLLGRFFPSLRKKWADWIGRWHKRTIKAWAHQVQASTHDAEWQSFLRAQKKIARQEAMKRKAAAKSA